MYNEYSLKRILNLVQLDLLFVGETYLNLTALLTVYVSSFLS